MGTAPEYAGMIEDHQERHNAYCDKHGYEYQAITEEGLGLTHPYFRLIKILEIMKEGKHSHIFSLDADTIVADFGRDMRETLPFGAWLAMTVHPYPTMVESWHWQSGVMYWRCCDQAIKFLEAVIECVNEHDVSRGWFDQTAMQDFLLSHLEYQTGIITLPYRWNNNLHDMPISAPIVAAWHGWGRTLADRRERMRIWAKYHPWTKS